MASMPQRGFVPFWAEDRPPAPAAPVAPSLPPQLGPPFDGTTLVGMRLADAPKGTRAVGTLQAGGTVSHAAVTADFCTQRPNVIVDGANVIVAFSGFY